MANLIRLQGGGEELAQRVENLDQSTTVKLYSGDFFEDAIGRINTGTKTYGLFQSTITTDKNGKTITTLTKSDLSDAVRNGGVTTEVADKKAFISGILEDNTIIGKGEIIGNGEVLNVVEESISI